MKHAAFVSKSPVDIRSHPGGMLSRVTPSAEWTLASSAVFETIMAM
jgi:hypothetical protein